MANFVERISVIIDTKTDQATGALKAFRTEVAAADGFVGKFKAGVGSLRQSATEFLTSGAGMATVVGGIGAAAGYAVNETMKLAQEVGQLSEATGLSTEAASRWIEVSNDLGIGSDKVAGLIEKMTKNLGATPDKFAEMGISVQTAADGTADMNATLLVAIQRIQGITDPTKRAKAAADLFGKGWADAAELVGMSASELKDRLESVSDTKVFSPEDVAQAREFRDSLADLQDIGEDLAIAVGKDLIPKLTDFVNILMAAKGGLEDLNDWTKKATGSNDGLIDGLERAINPAKAVEGAWNDLSDLFGDDEPQKKATEAVIVLTGAVGDNTDANKENAQATYLAGVAQAATSKEAKALAGYLDDVTDAANRNVESVNDLESAQLDLAESTDELGRLQAETERILSDSTSTDAEKKQALIDLRQAQIGTAEGAKKAAEEFARAQGAQDGSKASTMLQIGELQRLKAEFPLLAADIDKYIAALKRIPGTVTTAVNVRYGGGAGGTGANGSGVSGDTGNLVLSPGGGNVQRVQSVGGRGVPNVTINSITVNATGDGRAMVDAITAAVKDGVQAAWMANP